MTDTALATVIDSSLPMQLPDLKRQVQCIQQVMREVMHDKEHYGTIPGCGNKPTLLQPGAQKLALTFGFAAEYVVRQTDKPGGHREYEVRCKLTTRSAGLLMGEGVGCASTMESKYRFRTQAVDTGEQIPGDYQQNKGSYAAKGMKAQKLGDRWAWCKVEKVEHDNPADYYNTILKMAKKRAYVDAVLTATAASDIFTQDIEDDPELHGAPESGGTTGGSGQAGTAKTSPTGTAGAGQANSQSTQPRTAANANSGGTSGTFVPDEIREVKSGEGKNGPWCLYELTFIDGPKVRTFDKALVDIASQAGADGEQVYIEWEKDAKYNTLNLKALTKAQSGPPEPGDEGMQTPDDDPDNLKPTETLNTSIISVEAPKQATINGKVRQAWAIVTPDERVGTYDQRVADGCAAYAGTGELMALGIAIWKGKHKVVKTVQVAESPF